MTGTAISPRPEVGRLQVTKNVAYILMALAAVMWGTSGTLTALAIDEGATANEVAVFAAVFSAVILLPIVYAFDRPSMRIQRSDALSFIVFSVITGVFFSLAWYNAVDLTSVTTAVILLYSYPSLVTAASVFLLNEKMTLAKWVALPLTFVGCILVSQAYDPSELEGNLLGVALGLYTGCAAAVYYLWGKKFLKKYSANTVALYLAVLTVPGVIVLTNPMTVLEASLSGKAWAIMFLLGLVPGTIAFVISMIALKRIEASRASIVASIEPVAGVILAVLVISEGVESLQVLGVVLVVLGVILLRLFHKDEEEPPGEIPPSR